MYFSFNFALYSIELDIVHQEQESQGWGLGQGGVILITNKIY